jgi:hypothetical protein
MRQAKAGLPLAAHDSRSAVLCLPGRQSSVRIGRCGAGTLRQIVGRGGAGTLRQIAGRAFGTAGIGVLPVVLESSAPDPAPFRGAVVLPLRAPEPEPLAPEPVTDPPVPAEPEPEAPPDPDPVPEPDWATAAVARPSDSAPTVSIFTNIGFPLVGLSKYALRPSNPADRIRFPRFCADISGLRMMAGQKPALPQASARSAADATATSMRRN